MAAERVVTEWAIDPSKAEKGSKQASDAVKQASEDMRAQAAKTDQAIDATFEKDVKAKKGAAEAAKKSSKEASAASIKADEAASKATIVAARADTAATRKAARVAKALAAERRRIARIVAAEEKKANAESVRAVRELEKEIKRAAREAASVAKASAKATAKALEGTSQRIIRGVRKRGDETKVTLDKTRGSLRGFEKGLSLAAISSGNLETSLSGAAREIILTGTALGTTAAIIAAVSVGLGLLTRSWGKHAEELKKVEEAAKAQLKAFAEQKKQIVETNEQLEVRLRLLKRLGREATAGELLVANAAASEDKLRALADKQRKLLQDMLGGTRGAGETDQTFFERIIDEQRARLRRFERRKTPGVDEPSPGRDIVGGEVGGIGKAGKELRKLLQTEKEIKALGAITGESMAARELADEINRINAAREEAKAKAAEELATTEATAAANNAIIKGLEARLVATGQNVELLRLIAAGEDRRTAALTLQQQLLANQMSPLRALEKSGAELSEHEKNRLFFLEQTTKALAEQKALIIAAGGAPTPPGDTGLGGQIEKTVAGGVARGLVAGIREGGDAASQVLEATLTAVTQNFANKVISGEGGLFAQIFRLGAPSAAGSP